MCSVERPRVSSYRLNTVIGLLLNISIHEQTIRFDCSAILDRMFLGDCNAYQTEMIVKEFELLLLRNAKHL
jgi:hypothetical protein